ncbi:TetR/AcrR family transcriptional regulator [Actinosynnema sp. NPDC059797]
MSRREEAERNDRALLEAAREVLAVDGAHASVAAVAARAGVGIGSLYRRYRSKQELFQHLCEVALDQWLEAAEEGLARADPWEGLVHYVRTGVASGSGSLGPIAGTIEVTAGMAARMRRSDELQDALVARAHEAGVLRPDVTSVDLSLLMEQLGKSPLLDQVRRQGREDLLPEAVAARDRLVAIALAGLRPGAGELPGSPPDDRLLTERWAHG